MTEVQIWEMDSWSGRSAGKVIQFKDRKSALEYVKEFNSKNTLSSAPEYYEYAELI